MEELRHLGEKKETEGWTRTVLRGESKCFLGRRGSSSERCRNSSGRGEGRGGKEKTVSLLI